MRFIGIFIIAFLMISREVKAQIVGCNSTDILVAQRNAMLEFLQTARTGNPYWMKGTQWGNTSARCNITSSNMAGVRISVPSPPDAPYCCWKGVQCCAGLPPPSSSNATCGNGSTNCCPMQPIPGCYCSKRGVVQDLDFTGNGGSSFSGTKDLLVLDIGSILSPSLLNLSCSLARFIAPFNFIFGTLPTFPISKSNSYEVFTELVDISLNQNLLIGTLPVQLGMLRKLQILDLRDNYLTGTVPASLCGSNTRFSPLVDILLSRNQFNGTFNLEQCDSLVMLDIRSNKITALGNMAGYPFLHIFRASLNEGLTGTLPKSLGDSQQLVDWSVQGNDLIGTLPDYFINMTLLQQINLADNNLTGPLPAIFFERATLYTVQLQNNNFYGTIPASIGCSPLSTLNLQRNNFYGTIPLSMANLARSNVAIQISSNSLFCCGTNWTGTPGATIDEGIFSYSSINTTARLLPPFLQLSLENLVYYPPDENFKIYSVYTSWGSMRCPSLYYNPQFSEQFVFPNFPNLLCSPNNSNFQLPSDYSPPLVITGASPLKALNWDVDPQYYRYYGCVCENGYSMKTIDLPNFINYPVQACVADPPIDWFSAHMWIISFIIAGGLFLFLVIFWFVCLGPGTRPNFFVTLENAKKRMKREPTVGDKVSIVNTDIEGYSNFMKKYPELMTKALNTHNAVIRHCRWTAFGGTIEQEGDSYTLYFYDPFDAVFFCLMSQQRLMKQAWDPELFDEIVPDGPRAKRGSRTLSYIKSSLQSVLNIKSLIGNSPKLAGRQPSDRSFKGMRKGSILKPKPSTALSTGIGGPFVIASGSDSQVGSISGATENPLVAAAFKGPRVRMGVATGTLDVIPINASSVMEAAKTVADAGAGGQLLMDEATFESIKDRIEELSAVDHEGINLDRLNKIKPSLWVRFLRLCAGRKDDHEREAQVLDMGEYFYSAKKTPAVIQPSPVVASAPCRSNHKASQSFAFVPDEESSVASGSGHGIATTLGSGAIDSPHAHSPASVASSHSQDKRLHLYQILAPALVARGKKFGNTLALKEEWKCTNRPYFCAPGTLQAALGPLDVSHPIPNITMVFCMVEGGKAFAARSRAEAKVVHEVLSRAISDTLDDFPGGYLCRKQDGDLKYMLAFNSPCAALAWCLVMQEAAMYADWPETALQYFKEETASRKKILFRGPRLKMGVCDGMPKTIIPDHLGRADYHGASVNQAARYMDAAAHGGQIACEASLVLAAAEEFASSVAHMQAQPHPSTEAANQPRSANLNAPGCLASDQNPPPSPSPFARLTEDDVNLAFPPTSGQSMTTLAPVIEEASQEAPGGILEAPSFSPLQGQGQRASSSKATKQTQGILKKKSEITIAKMSCGSSNSSHGSVAGIAGSSSGVAGGFSYVTGSSSGVVGSSFGGAGGSVLNPSTQFLSSPALLPPIRPSYLSLSPLEPSPGSKVDESRYIGRAVALKIGEYKFKGSPESIEMVYLVNEGSEGRRFPSEPPKGKGNRVREDSGLYQSFELLLPISAVKYKEEYLRRVAEEGGRDDDSAEGDSGTSSPMHRAGTMLRAMSKRVLSRKFSMGPGSPRADESSAAGASSRDGWRFRALALTGMGVFTRQPSARAAQVEV